MQPLLQTGGQVRLQATLVHKNCGEYMLSSRKTSLEYYDKQRKHDVAKALLRSKRNKQVCNIVTMLNRYIEPLCIGLCGTTVIDNSGDAASKLLANATFRSLERSNVFNNALRSLGFSIIQLLKFFVEGANSILNNVYQMFTFSTSDDVNSYISNLTGFLWIPCIISILALGFRMIFHTEAGQPHDYNKFIQNALIVIILITGLPALLSTTASMTKTFVNADFNGRGSQQSNEIIAHCLTDFEYIYNWDNQAFDYGSTRVDNAYIQSGDYSYVNSIDINETMTYYNSANPDYKNNKDCTKWDSYDPVCALSTIVTLKDDGTYQCEHIDELQWWDFFGSGYYYRYKLDFITCMITLGAVGVAIIFSAIKVCRILWELAIYRVLAMFFSLADMHNGEKIKEILKAFAGAFIVIIVNTVLLKFYMIFSAWLTAKNIDGLSKSVMLVAVAIAVIDGPNLCQKLIGVDAGIRSGFATIGAMAMAGHTVAKTAKAGTKIGKEVGEFGKDVINKSAAIGGFVAGVGSKTASKMSSPSKPKDQKNYEKAKAQSDEQQLNAGKQADSEKQSRNNIINNKVAEQAQKKMADAKSNGTSYTSDSIGAYEDAVDSMIPTAANVSPDAITDMAEDAYIDTHSEQLMAEAVNIQDKVSADGKEISNRDALTQAFANKHKDPSSVTTDGTYMSADQRTRNKIDGLMNTQRQKGNTVQGTRMKHYGNIAQNAQTYNNQSAFKNSPEISKYKAAAAHANGRNYKPGDNENQLDTYQANMSMGIANKNEIKGYAQEYIAEQKELYTSTGGKEGSNTITENQAIAHVIANENDYGMAYGFTQSSAADVSEAILESDIYEKQQPDSTQQMHDISEQRYGRNRSINGNYGLNQNLGYERQSHNKPSIINSAKAGFEFGKNGRKKKK